MDLAKLNLRKEKVLNLQKQLNLTNQKAQVVLCLDYSGSMTSLYENGSVQELVERILPLGLGFDDNGEVEFYLFENGVTRISPNITLNTVNGYIKSEVLEKGYSMGGTEYAPVIEAVTNDFANIKHTGGFLGMGAKKTYEKMDLPVFVIFITDGENGDRSNAELAISEASNAGIFFQFIGIGYDSFNFLRKLDTLPGRNIDNANFFSVPKLSEVDDDQLYKLLLNEFPSFVTKARNQQLIK